MSWDWRRRKPSAGQLDSELQFHLEEAVRAKIAAGLPEAEARRQTALEFGGRVQIAEEMRDVYRLAWLEGAARNLKSGLRLARKSPAFSAAVIVTLALGIGANTAVFSAVDAVLLRPLPFPQSSELVMLQESERRSANPGVFVAPARLEDWNRLNSTFQAISGWYISDVSETSGTLPEKLTEALVAPRFLQTWGIQPELGRDFTGQEEHFGGPNAVLISDRFWRQRFHADPAAVGKQLRLERHSSTIVGVMPASFAFPDRTADVWTPSPPDAPYAQDRASTWFITFGRLKPGVTVKQATADLARVQAALGRQYPKTDAKLDISLKPLKETAIGGARRSLWVLFGAVSLLLLIACTNIAALLLARTTEREREISIRFSLGASRGSVIGQLLTECLVLASGGAALGLLVAWAGSEALRRIAKSIPRAQEISMDWRILVYTLVCAVAATILCGLFPAIRGTRRRIAGELARSSRNQVSARNGAQWWLVGIQTALAATLLVGAGLLLRSFQQLGRVSPGFETTHVLTFRISGNWGETGDMKKLTARIDRTLDQLRAIPGVRGAATSGSLPGVGGNARTDLKILEGSQQHEGKIIADSRFVSSGYFAAMTMPILAGEDCRGGANYFDSALVNSSFAKEYFGSSPAVGRHVELVSSAFEPTPAAIRGIVPDAREEGLNRAPVPTVYWCVAAPYPTPYFLLRTVGVPMAAANEVRRKIHSVEPARSVFDVAPLDEHLSDAFGEDRLRTMLLTMFAVTALLLAAVGLYGTLSYFVTVRRREIGLRLALGAEREQIVRQFLLKGIVVAGLGCVAGLCLAGACSRVLAGMLYGVSRSDPKTFVAVASLMVAVAGLSSLMPALRAAGTEPMRVLREE